MKPTTSPGPSTFTLHFDENISSENEQEFNSGFRKAVRSMSDSATLNLKNVRSPNRKLHVGNHMFTFISAEIRARDIIKMQSVSGIIDEDDHCDEILNKNVEITNILLGIHFALEALKYNNYVSKVSMQND